MKPLNILIVDDSEIIRDRIAEKLRQFGDAIKILQADNYSLALKLFISSPPEIIILDIQLPDGDGMDLLNIIKTIAPSTHVIILTNYPFAVFKEHCAKCGAEFFFDKSNDFEKLQYAVNQICTSDSIN
ncbi:MAG: response regulator [Bacteroidetes bacterium]|nr:response regulator [Bacteroidota bacterium]